MKLHTALFCLQASVVCAFAPTLQRSWVSRAHPVAASKDAIEAYKKAEEATAKFGVTSAEARLAWEDVEDIENQGGAIHLESLKATLEEECADLSAESRCREFEKNMDSLAQLTNAAKVVNSQIKNELLKLQAFKLGSLTAAASAVNSDAYYAAKAAAEACTPGSKEAAVAWEAVYDIVESADDKEVNMASLEDECFLNSSEKCVDYHLAMDELHSAIVRAENSAFNKAQY